MKGKQLSNSDIYIGVALLGLVITLLAFLFSGDGAYIYDWLALGNMDEWELADFFRHIGYGADLSKTYWTSVDACFPPLTYLFFHVLYLMNPQVPAAEAAADWRLVADSPFAIIQFIGCMLIIAILWVYAIDGIIGKDLKKQSLIITILLFFSFPFFAAIERGNPIVLTALLLLIAASWADADAMWKRRGALILIAIAVSMKIYPAIFGVMYLKKKRYKEFWQLVAISMAFFFIPFIFTGGWEGFKQFLELEFSGHYNTDFMKELSSIRGATRIIGARIGVSDLACISLGKVLENLFLVMSVIGCFLTKEKWKEVFYLSAICCFYMPTSWVYNTIYLALPLIFFLKDLWSDGMPFNRCQAIFFGLIFTIPIWFYFIGENPGTWVCLIAYVMWGINWIRTIISRA